MEDSSVQPQAGLSAPLLFRAAPSGWRVALGVLVSIATLAVTFVLLFLSLCFGLLLSSSMSHGSSDTAFIYAIFAATVLVPIGGTWLAVHLFRGPKRSGAAIVSTPTATPVVVQSAPAPVPAKEFEERIAYLRVVVLVAILAHAAVLVLNFSSYRGAAYNGWIVTAVVTFVLYQVPYAIILAGIATQPRHWAVALALMFPLLSLCFTVFSYLRLFTQGRITGLLFARNPLPYVLGPVLTVVVIIFAWRAWQAKARGADDSVQLIVFGVSSAIYLLLLQSLTPFLYRMVHF